VRLKRLIVQGFKSFRDRTTIHFDDGITGIVGPNGCGKSNIVDALFWVMGEQSAKHLRGTSMKDVIFSGSSKYTPATWAEVSLVLENDTSKHIHIGNKVACPTEIKLTRKLYRNSETEYRINGMPCRLKDIQEVFMDTGAGAKSYSIIAQGEINRLVQAKPDERRMMIEEVAGITKFKIRKKESLRKIEQTQNNLERLVDLEIEIEKNLKSLQRQAEKAERARSLKGKIKNYELVVGSHREFDLLSRIREGKNQLSELTLDLENSQTRKSALEIDLEGERLQKDEYSQDIERRQEEYNTVSNKMAALEERLIHFRKLMEEKKKLVTTRDEELLEIVDELKGRNERSKELTKKLEELERISDEDHDFSELEERVEHLKEEMELKADQVSELSDQIKEKKDRLQEVEQELFRNNSKQEEFSGNLQDLSQEIEALEGQYSGVSTEIADEREEVHSLEGRIRSQEEEEKELRNRIDDLKERYGQSCSEHEEKRREFIQVDSKLSSLQDLHDSLEGVKEGASQFLQVSEQSGYELLGGLIECDEQYTKAASTLLNEFMDTLVSESGNSKSFFQWLAANWALLSASTSRRSSWFSCFSCSSSFN